MHTIPYAQPLLARLDGQFKSLERILLGIDEGAIDQRPSDGTWSAAQHLAHLARYHEILDERITRILEETDPVLSRYKAEEDQHWPNWEHLPSTVTLGRLRPLRSNLVDRLEQLPDDAFVRIGIHPACGPMTIANWLEFFLVHEGHHMYAIFLRIRSTN